MIVSPYMKHTLVGLLTIVSTFAVVAVMSATASAQTPLVTKLSVYNEVPGKVSTKALHHEEAAITKEVNSSLKSDWGIKRSIEFVPSGGHAIFLMDENNSIIENCGCGGFHDYKDGPHSCPNGECAYVGYFEEQKNFWKEVLSHEVQEMTVDPWVNRFMPPEQVNLNGYSGVANWFVEVCDPVELDNYYPGPKRSIEEDHVLPAWYEVDAPGPYDYRQLETSPLETSEDGVAYFTDAQGNWYEYGVDSATGQAHAVKVASRGELRAAHRRVPLRAVEQ